MMDFLKEWFENNDRCELPPKQDKNIPYILCYHRSMTTMENEIQIDRFDLTGFDTVPWFIY